MPIPTSIGDLSTTAALNSPAGSDNLSTTDDYLRAIQGIVKTVYDAQSTTNGLKVSKTSDTGSAVLPVGTTAQRDGSPVAGYTRFNSTTGKLETWSGSAWASSSEPNDTAYAASWNGNLDAPTKNAVYDKIEAIILPVAASNAEYVTGTDTTKFLNSATARARNIVQGTSVASTSGTSIDFTGIPSWAKRITIMFSGVSTNGTSNPLIQIGDSGGIETTGYLGSGGASIGSGTGNANYTTGFSADNGGTAAQIRHGAFTLTLLDSTSNLWIATAVLGYSDQARVSYGGGSKSLSATLDRVRITTVNGTDTFDAGSINILYE